MDADTTINKGKYEKIINDFQNNKYDILLGTQMVSKGLDFPNVTLVGILNADNTLNIPDYKSNERSFTLFCQTSGRAGRNNKKGEVIIQTFQPEHPILQCVKNHNYSKYFQYEMKIRKTLKYPPYYILAQLKLKSKNYEKLNQELNNVKKYLLNNLSKESIVLGPAPSNPYLVNNIYSFEFLIKYRYDKNLKETIQELDKIFIIKKDIQLDIDIYY